MIALSLNSLNSLISLNSLMTAPLRPLRTLLPLGALARRRNACSLTTNNLLISPFFCSFYRLLFLIIVPKVEKIGIYTTEPFGILFVPL